MQRNMTQTIQSDNAVSIGTQAFAKKIEKPKPEDKKKPKEGKDK